MCELHKLKDIHGIVKIKKNEDEILDFSLVRSASPHSRFACVDIFFFFLVMRFRVKFGAMKMLFTVAWGVLLYIFWLLFSLAGVARSTKPTGLSATTISGQDDGHRTRAEGRSADSRKTPR